MSSIVAVYELHGPVRDAEARARALAVEQSHEFPTELAPEHALVSLGVVDDVEVVGADLARATVRFPADLAGGSLTQLLVLLFGNCSLQPGVRLVDVDLPAPVLAAGPGPRLGVTGVRRLVGAPARPLLATALKPVGLGVDELAERAYAFALGGVDLVKDDQGLADQRWAPFAERVRACAAAVERANARTGGSSIYLPALNVPAADLPRHVEVALDAGAGGFLVLPGVGGLDQVAHVAGLVPEGVPLMAHPALLGPLVVEPSHGIAADLLLGPLLRLAGADVVVFPSFGGRFSFTREQCLAIADGCRRDVPGLAPSLPAPGGGMTVERVPELVETYGSDTVLLIGGELHREASLVGAAERFRAAVDAA
ncbi:RuBisCO large subunit C-terminal-like domain-containing protein [Cellulomonas oligotrophica]|uniref:Ribulose-bisphosphate carboxylase large chain n=1 Tax=Cellulomonas oligotrophica TaxID=931536 RepID=A0A7Y9JXQ7_9CELL|nr:RuBisCO large subunit C-terminal-like domain-containing protein [Cellulomonas oligotrophica]NYD86136.1 ribulose-bisphosphate carboxylase large chain [Cellulomonas oligotrophica]GIG30856.1 hypothetical protein Col01nite_00150 [Cellulomonas oligotrophica]